MTVPIFSILESGAKAKLKVSDSRGASYLIPMLHCLPSLEPPKTFGYTPWIFEPGPGRGDVLRAKPSIVHPEQSGVALRLFGLTNNGIQFDPDGDSFISRGNFSLLGSTQSTSSFLGRNFETIQYGNSGGAKFSQLTSGANSWGKLTIKGSSGITGPSGISVFDVSQTGVGTVFDIRLNGQVLVQGPSSQIRFGSSSIPTTTYSHSTFENSNGIVGSISTNGFATAFNTSSDYRLKENVIPLTEAISRVNQLQVYRFNFVNSSNTVDGFIAHEVQAIIPECITGEKDGVDANGEPVYQGIDQSKIVPLAIAAIQECVKRIELLETELSSLKDSM